MRAFLYPRVFGGWDAGRWWVGSSDGFDRSKKFGPAAWHVTEAGRRTLVAPIFISPAPTDPSCARVRTYVISPRVGGGGGVSSRARANIQYEFLRIRGVSIHPSISQPPKEKPKPKRKTPTTHEMARGAPLLLPLSAALAALPSPASCFVALPTPPAGAAPALLEPAPRLPGPRPLRHQLGSPPRAAPRHRRVLPQPAPHPCLSGRVRHR